MPALSGGMMLYSRRSAKSVACSRLKVIGVSAFFFLPVLVAALTSADEVHSVTKTGWPAAISHLASSPSCVVLPDPSMPSTTNSFPGYSCGVVRLLSMWRLFLVIGPPHLEADGPVEHALERRGMAVRGPELQLRVARRAQPRKIIVVARVEIDAAEGLRVTPIEPLGEPDDGGERPDGAPQRPAERGVAVVRLLRRGLAVVARDERNHLDLVRLQSAQIPILDQIVRMTVVALVADMDADVVQQRAVLQPLALAGGQPVHAAGLIENAQREPRDLVGVLGPVAAALAELHDAAAPHVRVALDLADLRAVAMDVVEHQPLAQRHVAEREALGAKSAQDRVEQDRPGDREVRAARVERSE